MAETRTKPTRASVKDFISEVESEARRKDAEALHKLFSKVTGWKAQMWGPNIVGFGSYHYTYETGHSGEMCVVGFSPRKTHMVVYISNDFAEYETLKNKLGKVKSGTACLYINRLAEIDLDVLEEMIKGGVAAMKKAWPVTAV